MLYIILFILGLCFGSFGSVLTYRLGKFSLLHIWEGDKEFGDTMKSIAVGRSKCPHCNHTLHAKDLIPVVSYLSTGGKCRYCKKPIDLIYPLLEIGCGLIFMWVGYFAFQTDMTLLQISLWIFISWLLYLLTIYDIQHSYLHEPIWAVAAILTIWLLALSPGLLWYYAVQRGVIFFVFFLGIYYIAKLYVRVRWKKVEEGFGIGDVWLSPIIGSMFGLLQLWYTYNPSFFGGIQLFQRYIVITGVSGLLYAGLQKLVFPHRSIREIPFFPGMVAGLWIIMGLM